MSVTLMISVITELALVITQLYASFHVQSKPRLVDRCQT